MIDLSVIATSTPVLMFLLGAIAVCLVPVNTVRLAITLAVPLASLYWIWNLGIGEFLQIPLMGIELELMRVDKLSKIFGLIFSFAAFICALYAWHVRDVVQQVATLLYAGAAIGAVFAGDLVSLFVYWEVTALASVFLIWARRTTGAYATGMRYLIIQIGSGVLLIGGIALHYRATGSIAFDSLTGDGPQSWSLGVWLIFFAFGIKCAFPFLHNWLQDSYPAATVTGTVTLSAFTTKMAVYCFARAFPQTEMLIYIGAAMTLFPIFFAEIENDLRKVLAYSLNNQLGFMIVGVGVGTEMALNGTAAHAFAHIIYKALLFMSVGAVLYRTGTSRAKELGGLYRTMPITMVLCVVGAASISAFPLFSGFVAKSLILDGTAEKHYPIIWGILVFASAGVLSHSGIKIPFFTFFHHDSGKRPKEAPLHMLLAMGLAAAACLYIGIFPAHFYQLLPYETINKAYDAGHILAQLQLLLFAFLAFALLMRYKQFPAETNTVNLDFDWIYRKAAPAIVGLVAALISTIFSELARGTRYCVNGFLAGIFSFYGPQGRAARELPTGTMVLWLAILLGAALAINLLSLGGV